MEFLKCLLLLLFCQSLVVAEEILEDPSRGQVQLESFGATGVNYSPYLSCLSHLSNLSHLSHLSHVFHLSHLSYLILMGATKLLEEKFNRNILVQLGNIAHITCLTSLTCLTCLTSLTCLTCFICLICLTFFTCLACLT
jgi:hypothetical protein